MTPLFWIALVAYSLVVLGIGLAVGFVSFLYDVCKRNREEIMK